MPNRIARPPTYQKYWLCVDREIEHDSKNLSYLSEAGREARIMKYVTPAIAPGKHALDVGCCYGLFSFWMAKQGCKVTGIDKDPEVIEWCKVNGQKGGFTGNPRFEVANAKDYQGEFDIVLSLALIHHLWRQQGLSNAVTRLSSLVAPGGILYLEWISDLNKPGERRLDQFVRVGRECFKDMEIIGITRNCRDAFRIMFRFTK